MAPLDQSFDDNAIGQDDEEEEEENSSQVLLGVLSAVKKVRIFFVEMYNIILKNEIKLPDRSYHISEAHGTSIAQDCANAHS